MYLKLDQTTERLFIVLNILYRTVPWLHCGVLEEFSIRCLANGNIAYFQCN